MPAYFMNSIDTDPGTHVHVALNWVNHSSRMLKETCSLIEAGLAEKIYLVGKWEPSIPEAEDLGDGREIVRLKPWSGRLPKNSIFGFLVQVEMTIRLLIFCKNLNPSVIHCHWIEALPVGYLYRRLINKEAKIVYDAHELETEKFGVYNTFKKPLYQRLERMAIRYADLVLVVSPSIAGWYRREYGLDNLCVVRNVPNQNQSEAEDRPIDFRNIFGIGDDEIIFIYQGRLSPARSLEILIQVFQSLPRRYHIVIMGYGPLESVIREAADTNKNIHFHSAVPAEDVLSYTRAADVGIALIENVCLSYQYCLPNKLFEFILSGIPVIVSDCPDMADIVTRYRCGWTLDPTVSALQTAIPNISLEDIAEKKEQSENSSSTLGWRFEADALLQAYHQLRDEALGK